MNAITPQRAGLVTDLYELTMAAGYWQSGRHNDVATFELSIRALPTTIILGQDGRIIFRQAGIDIPTFVHTLETEIRKGLE